MSEIIWYFSFSDLFCLALYSLTPSMSLQMNPLKQIEICFVAQIVFQFAPHEFEMKVFSAAFGWFFYQCLVNLVEVFFKSSGIILIFFLCFIDLFIREKVLKCNLEEGKRERKNFKQTPH